MEAVKLKNIRVDKSMIRTMGRVAEAERVRKARLIEASAEHEASLQLVRAGRDFEAAPLSLRLREMQNHAHTAAENNTAVMIVPASLDSGIGRALRTFGAAHEERAEHEAGGRGWSGAEASHGHGREGLKRRCKR